ncbi:MAG: aminotransferase class IV family protein [Pseudoxanthomonas sp.]
MSALCNGAPATAADLGALALSNYGHFTVMVVRGGAVQGLDFHLRRLQVATGELFDAALDQAAVRAWIGAAVAGKDGAQAVRVTVFARDFDYRRPLRALAPDVLVTASPLAAGPKPALRVKSYRFARPLARVKHVGTFPLHYFRRRALGEGADDALFVDADGHVSEGATWNIGFWDGQGVIWPQAEALRGSAEHLLQAGLVEAGIDQQLRPVALQEVTGFRAAFACNATGLQPLAEIDGRALPADPVLLARLQAVLDARPWQPLAGALS